MPRIEIVDIETFEEDLDKENSENKLTKLDHRRNRKTFGKGHYHQTDNPNGHPHNVDVWQGGAEANVGLRRNT